MPKIEQRALVTHIVTRIIVQHKNCEKWREIRTKLKPYWHLLRLAIVVTMISLSFCAGVPLAVR
jgi:hypothetical protein